MATRVYFAIDTAPATPSSWSAGWNKTTGTVSGKLVLSAGGSATNQGISQTNAASGTSGHFTAAWRAISAPLAAQTISGNVKGQLFGSEAAGTDNYTAAFAIKVIKSDNSDRGVLLAVSASDDTSATPPELVVTTATNRSLQDASENTSIALSSLAVSAGDRLVIEGGFRQASTSTNQGRATPTNCDPASADLPEDNTTTTATSNGWVEFSNSVEFQDIVYVGSNATPADGVGTGTGVADPTAVLPPAGMLSGDLVFMIGQERAASAALAVSATGGQTWTTHAAITTTNTTARVFTCVFNGTWSASPSVDFAGTTCNSVQMHAYRAPTGYTWSLNQALVELDDATSPFIVTGQTTTGTGPTITLAGQFSPDDNSWSAAAAGLWVQAGTAQYRNQSGSDQSSTYAHVIQSTGGATGDLSRTQTANGDDTTTSFIISYAATAPLAFIAAKPCVIGQAINRASLH